MIAHHQEETAPRTAGRVLLVGGSGVVGRTVARWLRARHPHMPLVIGGRNLETARDAAQDVEPAQAVVIDLDAPRLGLEAFPDIAAVVMLVPDLGLNGQRFAQDLGVPFLSIGDGLVEMGPAVAQLAHHPAAAPVVLASHWAAGAGMFLALDAASTHERVSTVRIGVVLDPEDPAGPAALEDMQRLGGSGPGALVIRNGRRVWLAGQETEATVEAVDGRVLEAQAYSPFDIISLQAATGAQDVRLDLASSPSSRRLRGGPPAAEIVVEIDGERDGRRTRTRSTLEFPAGQASLTGLSAVLSLSAALGLEQRPPAAPGPLLPELLAEPAWFLAELRRAGAIIVPGAMVVEDAPGAPDHAAARAPGDRAGIVD